MPTARQGRVLVTEFSRIVFESIPTSWNTSIFIIVLMKISLRFASYAGHGKFSTSIIKNPCSIASNCLKKHEKYIFDGQRPSLQ